MEAYYLTIAECASILDRSEDAIQTLIAENKIITTKINDDVRVAATSLEEYWLNNGGGTFRSSLINRNSNVVIDETATISPCCSMDTMGGGHIYIGRNAQINRHAKLMTYGGDITINNNVTIQDNCIIYGHGGLIVGEHTMIAAGTIVAPVNHIYADPEVAIEYQGVKIEGLSIGRDVWVGVGSRILLGGDIEDGCVIGAGSVVTKRIPAYSVACGVPARVIKKRK